MPEHAQEPATEDPFACAVLWVLLAVAVGAALWAAGAMVLHLDERVYRLGPVRVAVVAVAMSAVLVGAWALARAERAALPLQALVIATAVAVALLLMSSLGFIMFPLLAMFGVVLVRASRSQPMPSLYAVCAAFLVTVGLGVILLAQPFTPIVRCLPNGVEQLSRRFEAGGSMTGSGSSTIRFGGGKTGMVHSGGRLYTYTCRNGELVDFRLER